ncbi:hypothetical protein CTI12_AA207730 [Artemisia annua]|uniref:Uncharacterized protein n=1 Tax=Artemisia annua TaxID=35608 RepID=A0A2U1P0U0_ARTAN|nr:hypothetical protein CTI12_AA207730 [Artemisia annua]
MKCGLDSSVVKKTFELLYLDSLDNDETTRRARQIRKTRQRWIWGSILAAVTVGSAALVWSYIPAKEGSSYTDHTPTHTSESNNSSQ